MMNAQNGQIMRCTIIMRRDPITGRREAKKIEIPPILGGGIIIASFYQQLSRYGHRLTPCSCPSYSP